MMVITYGSTSEYDHVYQMVEINFGEFIWSHSTINKIYKT